MNNKKIHNALTSPAIPEDLSTKIYSNWQSQLLQEKKSQNKKGKIVFACAASFIFATLIFGKTIITPSVVTAAMNDIIADEKQNIGISVSLNEIHQRNNMSSLLDNIPVILTKYCTLDDKKLLHLKIDNNNDLKEVHLFVNNNTFPAQFWQPLEGEKQNISWKIIKTENSVSVLVVYDKNTSSNSIDQLVTQLFKT